MFTIYIVAAIATPIIAALQGRNVFLALILGFILPFLAPIFYLLTAPDKPRKKAPETSEPMPMYPPPQPTPDEEQTEILRQAVSRLSERVENLEMKVRRLEQSAVLRQDAPLAEPAQEQPAPAIQEEPRPVLQPISAPPPPPPMPQESAAFSKERQDDSPMNYAAERTGVPQPNDSPVIPPAKEALPLPENIQPVIPSEEAVPPVETPAIAPQEETPVSSEPEKKADIPVPPPAPEPQAEPIAPEPVPVLAARGEEPEPVSAAKEQTAVPPVHKPAKHRDLEMNIGKYWLNKIGIGIFVLGVGFLIAYSSRYFGHMGPWGKLAAGYIISALLFWGGHKLRKDARTVNFGYVLTGGAWALSYFTVFAMHNFEQSRVIESPLVGILLLAAVSAGMILHSLKFQSEVLSGIALFVGYGTATLGNVQSFTLISCAVQAIVALVLVRRFKWSNMLFFGIIMTYAAHFLWVIRSIDAAGIAGMPRPGQGFFLMNAAFLTLYWALFTTGIHLLGRDGEEKNEKRLLAANIGNALFYFLLLYPDVTSLFPAYRFSFVVALGSAFLLLAAWARQFKAGKLFQCNAILGIGLVSAAMPIKYLPQQTSLIWLAELPLIYFAGLELKSRAIRAAAALLTACITLHYALILVANGRVMTLAGLGEIPVSAFTAFAASISLTAIALMLSRAFARGELAPAEEISVYAFSVLGPYSLLLGTWQSAALQHLTIYLFTDSLLIFLVGRMAKAFQFRMYAIFALVVALLRFAFSDNYHLLDVWTRWSFIAAEAACSYAVYFIYRNMRGEKLTEEKEDWLISASAVIAGALCLAAILRYVPEAWQAFTLGAVSLGVFMLAHAVKSPSLRVTALGLSLLATVIFPAYDLPFSGSAAAWIKIAALPCFAGGGYLLYRLSRLRGILHKKESYLPDIQFLCFQALLMLILMRHVPDQAITYSLALAHLALFGAGCLLREAFPRWTALALAPIVVMRFSFHDAFAEGERALPLAMLLLSYYALSFAYEKAKTRGLLGKAEEYVSPAVFMFASWLAGQTIWKYAPEAWVAPLLSLLGLGSLAYGCLVNSQPRRISGSLMLYVALGRCIALDNYATLGVYLRWLPVLVQGSAFAAAYAIYRKMRLAGKLKKDEETLAHSLFAGLTVLVTFSIATYGPEKWRLTMISLLGLSGFALGCALREPFARLCSAMLFWVTAVSALIGQENYRSLGPGLCWLPPLLQSAAMGAAYAFHRKLRLAGTLAKAETLLCDSLAAAFTVTVAVALYTCAPRYCAETFLAVFAAAEFFAGKGLNERFLRLCACGVFALVTMRGVTDLDDYSALGAALRWLPLALQMALMLLVYAPYRKMTKPGLPDEKEGVLPILLYAAFIGLFISETCFYTGEEFRALALTAAYLTLFGAGLFARDWPARASWLVLAPLALAFQLGLSPSFGTVKDLLYVTAINGGLYTVYLLSKHKFRGDLSEAETGALPVLSVGAALMIVFTIRAYTGELLQTPLAALELAALFALGLYLKDKTLTFSSAVALPYIITRRLTMDDYSGTGGLGKWLAVLSAPAALFAMHVMRVRNPGRIFGKNEEVPANWFILLPCILLLLHGLFWFCDKSLITLAAGISGLMLMGMGFAIKDKPLRYCGLTMFGVAILRIGFVDIAGLPIIYKIISFILLGLILLGVSFFYNRFMTDNTAEQEE